MNEFDLYRALGGYPIVTRSGRKILQIAYFHDAAKECCVVAMIEGNKHPSVFSYLGKSYIETRQDDDLFMKYDQQILGE